MNINTIGILGFGKFGSLLHQILTNKYGDQISVIASDTKVQVPQAFSRDFAQLVKESDLIVLAVPISSLELVVDNLAELDLGNKVIMDVASVKLYPARILSTKLPGVQIIATHPMFGPGAFMNSDMPYREVLSKMNMVIHNVSSGEQEYKQVFSIFGDMGINMIDMTPDEHDRISAESQFINILLNFVLKDLGLKSSKIDTNNFKKLLDMLDSIGVDIDLLQSMYDYNPYCADALKKYLNSEQIILKKLI